MLDKTVIAVFRQHDLDKRQVVCGWDKGEPLVLDDRGRPVEARLRYAGTATEFVGTEIAD